MPNEKQRRSFSDVHKRQLFHWIGADIDEGLRRRKLTVEKARETYLRICSTTSGMVCPSSGLGFQRDSLAGVWVCRSNFLWLVFQ